jgi:hypothetical protein
VSTLEHTEIERLEITVGPFTSQARRCGPPDGTL